MSNPIAQARTIPGASCPSCVSGTLAVHLPLSAAPWYSCGCGAVLSAAELVGLRA